MAKRLREDKYKVVTDDSEEEVEDAMLPGAVAVALQDKDRDSVRISKVTNKGASNRPVTEPAGKPKTDIDTVLERLRYPYSISLPSSDATLMQRKAKGIPGVDATVRYGRIYLLVENAQAMSNLYRRLSTKRMRRTVRAIVEGIRRSVQ